MKQEAAGREAGAIATSTDEAGDSDNALQRAEAGAIAPSTVEAGEPNIALQRAEAGDIAPSTDGAGDSDIALRLRRKLLKRLEKMADEIPDGAVTEYKTQDDSAVKLFKLRDLTAAYKELACDLPLEGEDRDGVKVVVDV